MGLFPIETSMRSGDDVAFSSLVTFLSIANGFSVEASYAVPVGVK